MGLESMPTLTPQANPIDRQMWQSIGVPSPASVGESHASPRSSKAPNVPRWSGRRARARASIGSSPDRHPNGPEATEGDRVWALQDATTGSDRFDRWLQGTRHITRFQDETG